MNDLKPLDRVRRLPPSIPKLATGHNYWGLQTHAIGIVREVVGASVYIDGYYDWPHHAATLELVPDVDTSN